MARKSRPVLRPQYLKEFKCIAELCEDNCCIGWDVEIDKKTYEKYTKINDKELSTMFSKYIYENDAFYDCEVNYASVQLLKHNRCPFLNECNLCKIQAKMGESYLSNVCATYPRSTNEVDGVVEYSATLSCPEAAKLILQNKDGIRFHKEEESVAMRKIVNCNVNTKKHGGYLMVKYLKELRQFTIDVLQDRSLPLLGRLWSLYPFYEELKEMADNQCDEVLKMIDQYRRGQKIEDLPENSKDKSARGTTVLKEQYRLMKEITKHTNITIKIDSKKYDAFVKEASKGISKKASILSKEKSEYHQIEARVYEQAHNQLYTPFTQKSAYILENYLVNFVFQELFPAGESTEPLESYGILVLRYGLIQFYLTSIACHRGELTEELTITFIQAFSKAIEHHHTYLECMVDYMRKKQGNTREIMAILLGI